MANSIIQLPVDSTGKKLDTEELVVGANTVHRERHQIAGDSDTDIAPVTAADGLLVNLGANNDVVDTAAETSLAVIDDWDESDRAKVNPIVGQAGIAAGAGAVGVTVQRMTLASDDPAVASLQTLDNAIAGSEMQVDVVGALPAGANNIGDVDIASLPNEGQQTMANSISVAIASDQSTVPVSLAAGGTTQYAEDTAHSSGDLVTLAGVVQQSADAALSSDGDRSVMQVDASGFAKVNVKASALPSGASTLAEQQTQTTHLAAIETAVEIIDNAIAGSEMQVDIVAALPAGTNNIGDVDVLSSALPTGASTLAEQQSQTTHLATIAGDTTAIETAIQIIDDWDESDRAKVNPIAGQAGVQGASGVVTALTQRVVLATDVALPAGTNNIGDVDVLTMPVTEVVGDVAADAAVPANPLSIGGRASTAVPTAVSADGDSVYNWLNRLGMQVVSAIPGLGLNADPHTLLSETAQYTTTQTSAVLVAGGASERIVVTSIQIQVGGTTAGTVQVYFGTGAYARGTDEAIFDGEFAPSATLKPGFFAAPPSGFRAGALGDDILVTTSAAINPITITVWYYILGV